MSTLQHRGENITIIEAPAFEVERFEGVVTVKPHSVPNYANRPRMIVRASCRFGEAYSLHDRDAFLECVRLIDQNLDG